MYLLERKDMFIRERFGLLESQTDRCDRLSAGRTQRAADFSPRGPSTTNNLPPRNTVGRPLPAVFSAQKETWTDANNECPILTKYGLWLTAYGLQQTTENR